MVRIARIFLSALILLSSTGTGFCANDDLNTALMNSTFEIVGPGTKTGEISFGTVFIVGRPSKAEPNKGRYALVTTAHVLDGISGDQATVFFHKKDATGIFQKVPFPLAIRNGGINLYVKNPSADVAAIYATVPTDAHFMVIPQSVLVTDSALEEIELHPGDTLLCLGFPLLTDMNSFPVIRSGVLASYPITPSKTVKQYFYNFHVFPGNSGWPVYFSYENRIFASGTHIGRQQGVVGLVTQQVNSALPEFKNEHLDIAIVVPASFIHDTIAMLPEP